MKRLLGALVCALVAAATTPVSANLVTNGGFDADNPAPGNAPVGWTFNMASIGSDFFVGPGPTFGAFSGPNSANFGSVGNADDELSQSLATTAGVTYQISFELAHDSTNTQNDFTVDFGSTQLLSLVNAASFGYTRFTYDVTATSSSTLLAFFGREVPAWYDLDDVEVVPTSAVPEPASLVLLGSGLVAAAAARRRKKQAKA